MPKKMHVYLEVMPDGKVMEGIPMNIFDCSGCVFYRNKGRGNCLKKIGDYRCNSSKNPLNDHIIYKDTGKRVRKL